MLPGARRGLRAPTPSLLTPLPLSRERKAKPVAPSTDDVVVRARWAAPPKGAGLYRPPVVSRDLQEPVWAAAQANGWPVRR
eukprot:482133-Pyramimonas_sp.AAC.1